METSPRILTLAVALVLVFGSPHVVGAARQASAPGLTSSAAPPQGSAAPAAAATGTPPPAPQAASAVSAPPIPQGAGPALEPQGYTYRPDGRRDPFVNLLLRGSQTQTSTVGGRAAGLSGLDTGEVTLKGTIESQDGFVGILQGADNRTYIVRAGDRLHDGTIRMITQDSMVVTQQVTDPLSLEKQREVRKVLRQTEEAK